MSPGAGGRPPYFVVSTGRCGSTFLSEILSRHPGVLSISEFLFSMEPDVFPAGMVSGPQLAHKLSRRDPLITVALQNRVEPSEFRYPIDEGHRFDREHGVPAVAAITLPHLGADPDAMYDEIVAFAERRPSATIGQHYAALFEWLRERLDRDLWVERTGGSLQYIPHLMEHFPGSRLIHLFRDGRETAISMSKRDNFRLMFAGVEIERLTGVNPFTTADPPELTGLPYPLSHLLPGSFDIAALRDLDVPLERFGLHWSSVILRGLRHLRGVDPERVLPIAYETLVLEPVVVVDQIAEFLGIEPTEGWIDWAAGAARRPPSNWPGLPEPDRSRLDAACRIANGRMYGPGGPPVLTHGDTFGASAT